MTSVKRYPAPQMKNEGRSVHLDPALGQIGDELRLLVLLDESIEEELMKPPGEGVGPLPRVEILWALLDQNNEAVTAGGGCPTSEEDGGEQEERGVSFQWHGERQPSGESRVAQDG